MVRWWGRSGVAGVGDVVDWNGEEERECEDDEEKDGYGCVGERGRGATGEGDREGEGRAVVLGQSVNGVG